MIDTLERRTDKRVEFLTVDACMQLKSPKDSGFGSPDELRGLKRVHIDTRGNAARRERIALQRSKRRLSDLKWLPQRQTLRSV